MAYRDNPGKRTPPKKKKTKKPVVFHDAHQQLRKSAQSQEPQFKKPPKRDPKAVAHQQLRKSARSQQPAQRQGKVERAKAQEKQYVSQGKAVKKINKRITVRGKRYFPTHPVQALQHKEARALQALSDLHDQDPRKYAKNVDNAERHRHHGLVNQAVRAFKFGAQAGAGQSSVSSTRGRRLPGATASAESTLSAAALGKVPTKAIEGVGKALVHKPGKTTINTAKGLGTAVASIPAAAIKTTIDTVEGTKHGDPLRGVKNIAKEAGKDYKRRYGPLTKPGQRGVNQFARRVEKEGAAGEVLDASTLVAGGGGAALRGAGALARTGKFGDVAKSVATERPRLRVSGGEAKPQNVHPNLAIAGAQRLHDNARRRKSEKRVHEDRVKEVRSHVLDVETVGRRERSAARSSAAREQEQKHQARVSEAESRLSKMKPGTKAHAKQSKRVEAHRAKLDASRKAQMVRTADDEVVPLRRGTLLHGAEHKQGIRAAARKGRMIHHQKHEQVEQVVRGSNPAIAALTHAERRGLKYAMQLGIRDPKAAVEHLTQRRADIIRERENAVAEPIVSRNFEYKGLDESPEAIDAARHQAVEDFRDLRRSGVDLVDAARQAAGEKAAARIAAKRDVIEAAPSSRVPAVLRKTNDELPHITRLINEADQTFTPRLGAHVDRERRRTKRAAVGDPGLSGDQALSRIYAQQAYHLGLKQGKDESLAAFAHRVRVTAKKKGLTHPSYFPSEKRPMVRSRDRYTGGSGAMMTDKTYTGKLFREGREDVRPEVHSMGLLRNIKRKHNWNLVADTVESEAFPWSRKASGTGHTTEQLRNMVDQRRITEDSVALWNPGRFHESAVNAHSIDGDQIVEGGLDKAFDDAATTFKELQTRKQDFRDSHGWVLIPRGVYDELRADTRPSSGAARGWDVSKTQASRLLLATSPKWLQLQVISNAVLAGLAGTGPVDMVKAQIFWYKELSHDQRMAVEPYLGLGRFQESVRKETLGETNSRLVNAYRALKKTAFFQRPRKPLAGRTPAVLNPFDALFRVDHAQNNFFRRAVLYNHAKREAYKNMGDAANRMMERQRHLENIFTLGPKEQIKAIIDNKDKIEQHAAALNDFLGDYQTFTAKERRYLGRSVMFYAFLRFSLRFTFYTMPIKHPLISSIAANLGRLEEEELKKLLGGKELPYGIGKFYFRNGKGELRSLDLRGANPTGNAITNIKSPNQIVGLMPPIVSMAITQAFGIDPFTNRPLALQGKEPGKGKFGLDERARVALNQVMDLIAPLREWEKAHTFGRPQGADSIMGDRPTTYEDADKQLGIERAVAKAKAETNPLSEFGKGLTPFFSKPERVDQVAEMQSLIKQRNRVIEQIKKMNGNGSTAARIKGGATDEGDFASEKLSRKRKKLSQLTKRINQLQAQGKPAKRPKSLSPRPLTYNQQIQKKVRDATQNPAGRVQDEVRRKLERARIQSGG